MLNNPAVEILKIHVADVRLIEHFTQTNTHSIEVSSSIESPIGQSIDDNGLVSRDRVLQDHPNRVCRDSDAAVCDQAIRIGNHVTEGTRYGCIIDGNLAGICLKP